MATLEGQLEARREQQRDLAQAEATALQLTEKVHGLQSERDALNHAIRSAEEEAQETQKALKEMEAQQQLRETKERQLQEKILALQREHELTREQLQREHELAQAQSQKARLDPQKLSRVQDHLRSLSAPLQTLKNEVCTRANVICLVRVCMCKCANVMCLVRVCMCTCEGSRVLLSCK